MFGWTPSETCGGLAVRDPFDCLSTRYLCRSRAVSANSKLGRVGLASGALGRVAAAPGRILSKTGPGITPGYAAIIDQIIPVRHPPQEGASGTRSIPVHRATTTGGEDPMKGRMVLGTHGTRGQDHVRNRTSTGKDAAGQHDHETSECRSGHQIPNQKTIPVSLRAPLLNALPPC